MSGKTKVNKALSPEETAVLENIGSLIEQLKSSGSAVETDVMNAGIVPEDNEYEEDPEMVAKENNGPTANPEDKAEDRVEDPTDITAGNLSEVGKSLNALVELLTPKKQPVRKSATPRVDQSNALVMKALADISTVMKSLADQQKQQDDAISNILEGIGFTAEVQKSLPKQTPKQTPVGALGNDAVVSELLTVLKDLKSGNDKPQYNSFNVKKSQHDELRNAMGDIFSVNK